MNYKLTNTHICFLLGSKIIYSFKIQRIEKIEDLLVNCEVYEIDNPEMFDMFNPNGRDVSNVGYFIDETTLLSMYEIINENSMPI